MRIGESTITVERGTALANLIESADRLYRSESTPANTERYNAALWAINELDHKLGVLADVAEQDPR